MKTALLGLVEKLKGMAPGKQEEAFSVTEESIRTIYEAHR